MIRLTTGRGSANGWTGKAPTDPPRVTLAVDPIVFLICTTFALEILLLSGFNQWM